MKQKIVKATRKILPKKAVNGLETVYRKNRLRVLSKKYGHPAKKIKTLAITGTNGKTTSLSMLNKIIKEAGYTTILSTTAGVEVNGEYQSADTCQTVPPTEDLQRLYELAVKQNIDYFLLEVTSHALEQHKIPKLDLRAAGFTNLTQEHLDYHKTMKDYADQKIKLFTDFNAQNIILNSDDQWFEYFSEQIDDQIISYGTAKFADYRISNVKLFKQGSDITLKHKEQKLELSTPMAGRYNAYNAALATAMAKSIGIKDQDVINGLANFEGVKGRLEWLENELGIDVMVDYAHTPDGIEQLLEFAKETTKGKVSIIFGSAGKRDYEKRPLMGQSAAKYADRVFVTDEEPRDEDPKKIRDDIMAGIIELGKEDQAISIADRGEAIRAALEVADEGDLVIVAGLGHQMEREVGDNEHIEWSDIEETKKILRQLEKEKSNSK